MNELMNEGMSAFTEEQTNHEKNPARCAQSLSGHIARVGTAFNALVQYPLVMTNITNWKDPPFIMGKSTIITKGPFSIAM